MEYPHVSSRFSQPPAMQVYGGNYRFWLPIFIASVDSIWLVPVIIRDPFSYSHTHGVHPNIRQTSRGGGAPFQPSGSLPVGVHEDDTWILNVHDHHPLLWPPEASPQDFQPSGSLPGGVHEDDTWILNVDDHHPLLWPPEASPQDSRTTSNGLTEHTVSKFLETRNSEASGGDEEEICVVCQDDLISGQIATLDCRHRYHVECIKTWLTRKNFCPICKAVAIGTVDS